MPVTVKMSENVYPGLPVIGASPADTARIVNNMLTGGLNVVGFLDVAEVVADGSPCVVLDPRVNAFSVILFTPFVNANIKDLTVTDIQPGQFTLEWDPAGHPTIVSTVLRYAVLG